ncbi:MAG: DEAD/DEAH box helicase [Promethearchaeota archaeon]
MKFNEFQLSEATLKGLKAYGFVNATEIQRKVIPPMLEGRCIVGQAKTGSGKTLAFGIPIIERLYKNLKTIQAIIISPTRELAKQIAEEISKAAKFTKLKTMTIYGGVSFDRQVSLIQRGTQIVVATPGRLLDHLQRGLRAKPKIIILDEADKMFDMGFYEDVSYILKLLNGKTTQQFGFFGATIPDQTLELTKKYMQNPVIITIRNKNEERIPESIEQVYYISAESSDKLNTLINLLNSFQNSQRNHLKILIFAKTRFGTKRLAETLNQMGFPTTYINSDMRQATRENTLEAFEQRGMFLVATDVVARGIDIENVTHVINYDIPEDIKSYVHRIGRTGRMGKKGMAITFVTPEQLGLINEIERKYKTTIKRRYFRKGRGPNYFDSN